MLRLLGLSLGLLQAGAYDTSVWKCFDEEPVVVKYKDTGLPVELPHYKTMIGGWGSWVLTQWMATILLKEKMGVDVDYWCSGEDYSKHWDCDTDYPHSTWDHVQNGVVDYVLECWPVAGIITRHFERLYSGKIVDLGATGTYGLEYLYTANYDGNWNIGFYNELKNPAIQNTVYNEMKPIFDKYKGNGWFKTYSKAWEEPGVRVTGESVDTLVTSDWNLTKPFIMTQGWSFASPRVMWDKINKMGLAEDWDFYIINTEEDFSTVLADAFAAKAHFIALLWNPGFELAPDTFQKQLVSFPVPQTIGCVQNATCESQVSPLFKIGNPETMKKIPEAREFLMRFRVESNMAINAQLYDQRNNGLSWKQAACNWLKDPENHDKWAPFIVPIVREQDVTPAWVHAVRVGGLVFTVAFVLTLTYLMWRCLKQDNTKTSSERDAVREKYIREAKINIAIIAVKTFLEVADVGTTMWSLWTCFKIAGDLHVLIAAFCLVLVLEIIYSVFATKERFNLAMDSLAIIRGTDLTQDAPNSRRATIHRQRRKSRLMFKKASEEKIKNETITFVVALGEDLPSIIVTAIVMLMGYTDHAFIISFAVSCICFGHKITSLEKIIIWKKKTPFHLADGLASAYMSERTSEMDTKKTAAISSGEVVLDDHEDEVSQ